MKKVNLLALFAAVVLPIGFAGCKKSIEAPLPVNQHQPQTLPNKQSPLEIGQNNLNDEAPYHEAETNFDQGKATFKFGGTRFPDILNIWFTRNNMSNLVINTSMLGKEGAGTFKWIYRQVKSVPLGTDQ
ncbi:hypothetical protein ECE50_030780, partial [Chitinophaga sp. Mgbs1]|nr:hypothetical protein [Chitinophaga solisilvae]